MFECQYSVKFKNPQDLSNEKSSRDLAQFSPQKRGPTSIHLALTLGNGVHGLYHYYEVSSND